jgi:hypothetical protein
LTKKVHYYNTSGCIRNFCSGLTVKGEVYGYSTTIGPDGKPRVKEFGNVKSPMGRGYSFYKPVISSEREN